MDFQCDCTGSASGSSPNCSTLSLNEPLFQRGEFIGLRGGLSMLRLSSIDTSESYNDTSIGLFAHLPKMSYFYLNLYVLCFLRIAWVSEAFH